MRPGLFYMHENGLDACILVKKAFQVPGQRRLKVRAEWYNLGYCGVPRLLNTISSLDIKNPEEWRNITSLVFNPRTEPGLPK